MLHIPGFSKFCSSRNLTAVKEMDNWKATPRDNALLMICNGAPIPDGCPTDASTKELLHATWQWSNYSLLFPCSISFAESLVPCLRNKAYVYLLTYIIVIGAMSRGRDARNRQQIVYVVSSWQH